MRKSGVSFVLSVMERCLIFLQMYNICTIRSCGLANQKKGVEIMVNYIEFVFQA